VTEKTVYLTLWITGVIVAVFFVARRIIQVDKEESKWL